MVVVSRLVLYSVMFIFDSCVSYVRCGFSVKFVLMLVVCSSVVVMVKLFMKVGNMVCVFVGNFVLCV